MTYTPKRIGNAEGDVLTLEELRQQCEVLSIDSDGHPDDSLLQGLLAAAVEHAERFTGLSIALRTYEIAMDKFPDGAIELPKPPLVELLSFTSSDDSDGPVDQEAYIIDDYSEVVRIAPVGTWPSITAGTNRIKVRYRAGYSSEDSDASPLPANIRQALLLMVGHWYLNREDSTDKALTEIPNGAMCLLRPMRVLLGMA